jgi:thiol-disulfide isomerase/thioredoxin
MKKIILLSIGVICNLSLFAQKGVNFENISFPEALTKAKQASKLVFMDCYTSWCGPCKLMANTVFPLDEVGEFFNPRFISVKYDMEKGEGVELAKKYGVRAYPTFLILDASGEEMHRIVGAFSAGDFIGKVGRGSNETTSARYLKNLHAAGKITNDQLLVYRQALTDGYETNLNKEITRELIGRLTAGERLQAKYWPLFDDAVASPFPSESFQFVYDHHDELARNVGKEKIDAYLFQAWSGFLKGIYGGRTADNTRELLAKGKEQVRKIDVVDKEFLLAKFHLAETVLTKDQGKIITALEAALPLVTVRDNAEILSVLSPLLTGKPVPKENHRIVAGIYEKYLAMLPVEVQPNWVKHNMMIYKKSSCTGVYFEPFTPEEAKSWAEKRWGQMIYVYLYRTKDKAGQAMERKVFPREETGEALRVTLCVKYDVSHEDGRQVKEQYGIKKTPTHLLLTPAGEEFARKEGELSAEAFIAWIKASEEIFNKETRE